VKIQQEDLSVSSVLSVANPEKSRGLFQHPASGSTRLIPRARSPIRSSWFSILPSLS